MKTYLNTDIFISPDMIERRKQNWDAFFSRIENSTSNIDNPVDSVLSFPEQNKHTKNKKSMYKSSRRRHKKPRKLAYKWRAFYKKEYNINKKYHLLNNEINKLEVKTTNGIEESNAISISKSSLINSFQEINDNNKLDIVTSHSYELHIDIQNNLISGLRCKQSKQCGIIHTSNSTKIQSNNSCMLLSADQKLFQKYKCKELVILIEKLDYSKFIFDKIISKNNNEYVNSEENISSKESQTDKNYMDEIAFTTSENIEMLLKKEMKHELLKYVDKENMKVKTLVDDENNTKSIVYNKELIMKNTCYVLLDSSLCNSENNCIISNDSCNKLHFSEKAIRYKFSQNYITEQQEKMHNDIKIKTYTQKIWNSMYSTNKRKYYSGFNNTLEQTTKKRKTMTLHNLLNQSVTESSTIVNSKEKTIHSYTDDVHNKQIKQSDNLILLTIEDFSNGTI